MIEGFKYGPGAVDTLLDSANAELSLLKAWADNPGVAATTPDISSPIASTGALNVFDFSSMDLNSQTLTLNSRAGLNDLFLIRVMGAFTWSDSILAGTALPSNILWYFPNASTTPKSVLVNNSTSVFGGTMFAPNGLVEYHNPATFTGAIWAKDVLLHSDFNLTNAPFTSPTPTTPVPLPNAALGAVGLLGALAVAKGAGRRRSRTSGCSS